MKVAARPPVKPHPEIVTPERRGAAIARLQARLSDLLPQSRLFRKYAALLAFLVTVGLIAASLLGMSFLWQAQKSALGRLQKEKAVGAAMQIAHFVKEIEGQIGWTTHAALVGGAAGAEQRRFDFIRLLRQVPAITELSYLDPSGVEQLKISRSAMDQIASNTDMSAEPKFSQARANRVWTGPVYFHKQSEPYMTMAVSGAVRNAGVTVAEVNLKFIWDVVSAIHIGKHGHALVVDETGRLIAHPDISLVLRRTDLSKLPLYTGGRVEQSPQSAPEWNTGLDYLGREVLSAHAPIASLGWTLFVQLPVSEALQPVYEQAKRMAMLVLVGIGLAGLSGLWFAGRLAQPIQSLRAGAAQIGEGALDQRIIVKTGDELETLADEFNAMAERLEESYATLERKVETRTRELAETLKQQTATAEVLKTISRSAFDLQHVLGTLVDSAAALCEAPMVAVHLSRDGGLPGVASYGFPEDVKKLLQEAEYLPGSGSLGGRVLSGCCTVVIPDVLSDREYKFTAFLDRTAVRGMLGVPLRREGEPIGVLVIFRQDRRPFTARQIDLAETIADQAAIAINNVRLFEEVQARTREVTESLRQQMATAEVLKTISRSTFDLQKVLDTLTESASALCEAEITVVRRQVEGAFPLVAAHGLSPEQRSQMAGFSTRPDRGSVYGRVALEGRTIHVPDIAADPEISRPLGRPDRGVRGVPGVPTRAILGVPLLREGQIVGTLALIRREPQPFTRKQIELAETFADQAVIAIENARLFEEVQARTKEVTEALEFQTATSDVLAVISKSRNEVGPVFEAIITMAERLCRADFGFVYRQGPDGRYHFVTAPRASPAYVAFRKANPIVPGDPSIMGRALESRRSVHVADVKNDGRQLEIESHRLGNIRSALAVPLMHDGRAIGVLGVVRSLPDPFTERQISLVETFADQAVIAIENARLFEAEQTRSKELQESLEFQTAVADVFKIIGRSSFDLEPVLQSVVHTAARLCRADKAIIYRNNGGIYGFAAGHGNTPEYLEIERRTLIPVTNGTLVGRTALARSVVHVADSLEDAAYEKKDDARIGNVRTMIGVPLLRGGIPIGVIALARSKVEPFAPREIELVSTFADQAAIAIENARLLQEIQERSTELSRTVSDLKALSEIGQVVSSTLDPKRVLRTVVERAVGLANADAAVVFQLDEERQEFDLVEVYGLTPTTEQTFNAIGDIARTGMGEAIRSQQPVQISDMSRRPAHALRDAAVRYGLMSALIVPLIAAERSFGALTILRKRPGAFAPGVVGMMQSFASQSAIAIQNARLFKEIETKGREIEIASQHKSQFLANMSHELRTPLNAILGYAELLADGTYGELSERPRGVLERIERNGRHLLGLINDVLDLSKIEAGEMSLASEAYAWSSLIRNVIAATEPLATQKGLRIETDIADGLPRGTGDARRLNQVLLNLVGNAIKFTDQGSVRVAARMAGDSFQISVTDTGPGIAAADQAKIFEKFQQVDNSSTRRKGGTGLGLSISKELVELHGGRIQVHSQIGEGSTFELVIPCHGSRTPEAEA